MRDTWIPYFLFIDVLNYIVVIFYVDVGLRNFQINLTTPENSVFTIIF